MKVVRVSPEQHPLKKGESWWVVHPNDGDLEFSIPRGAYSYCQRSFNQFEEGKTYPIVSNDKDNGWISIATTNAVYEMPYYVFARYFDKDSFIKIAANRKFHRNPTQKVQLELFED